MRQHPWVGAAIAVILIFSLFGVGCYTTAGSRVVATERWASTGKSGNRPMVWTFSKKENGKVVVNALDDYDVTDYLTFKRPFTEGGVTVSGPVFSFVVTGTAIHSEVHPAGAESLYIMKVKGEVRSGKGNGSYTIRFTTPGWPLSVSGKLTWTRLEGSSITE